MRFHFWHIRDFSERKYSYLFVKWAKKSNLLRIAGIMALFEKPGLLRQVGIKKALLVRTTAF